MTNSQPLVEHLYLYSLCYELVEVDCFPVDVLLYKWLFGFDNIGIGKDISKGYRHHESKKIYILSDTIFMSFGITSTIFALVY